MKRKLWYLGCLAAITLASGIILQSNAKTIQVNGTIQRIQTDRSHIVNLNEQTSNNIISLTEPCEFEISFSFEEIPNDLGKLQWYFGGKKLKEWKVYEEQTPLFTFKEPPHIGEDGKIHTKIVTEAMFKDAGLYRKEAVQMIGEQTLEVKYKNESYSTQCKFNLYDSYHTYDELHPAINTIINNKSNNIYMQYETIGKSVENRDIGMVVVAKDEASVKKYLNQTLPEALEQPDKLQKEIQAGNLKDYKVPIFINNVHPDEAPGVDAQIELIRLLADEENIKYNTTNGEKDFNVNQVLEHIIFVFCLTENPDGRYYNYRQNLNNYDLNLDHFYQTQPETQALTAQIVKWNPIALLDLHGFEKDFIIEPCTGPHNPNVEYDLIINPMMEMAQIFGDTAIQNTTYESYTIPARDYVEANGSVKKNKVWSDITSNTTPNFAVHLGALGQTIEVPDNNRESLKAFVYGILGYSDYLAAHKERFYLNQLEYLRRGVEGREEKSTEDYFLNSQGEIKENYREKSVNGKFFPEYYVLPVDIDLQKNPAAVEDMINYFIRNGVKVEKLIEEATVNDITYPKGSMVLDMHQAKRGMINDSLYNGIKLSDWYEANMQTINNFPALRGFDCKAVWEKDVFKDKTQKISGNQQIPSTFIGEADAYVSIKNNSLDAVQAVNALLKQGKKVAQVISEDSKSNIHKGDFIVAYSDFEKVKNEYTLIAKGIKEIPDANYLKHTKVYIAGDSINNSYLGYQYVFEKQMNFEVVHKLNEADIIIDGQDTYGEDIDTFKKIKNSRKPIIAVGPYACSESFYLSDYAVDYERKGFVYDALLKVNYADDLITSGYELDNELYNLGGGVFTNIPNDAKVLINIETEDFYSAGWFPRINLMSGMALALSYQNDKVDFISFSNVLGYNAHQTDDYRLISNAIFSKRLGEKFE